MSDNQGEAISTTLSSPPTRRREITLLCAALILGLAGGFLLLRLFSPADGTNLEEAALDDQTTSLFAAVDDAPVHCRDSRDIDACIAAAGATGMDVAVWLGNSQLHAVNQLRPGQQTAPGMLHSSLIRRGLYLITASQPNANLQEHYVLFEYLRARVPVKALLLPVVYDDFRENGLRAEVARLMQADDVRRALSTGDLGQRLLAQTATLNEGDSDFEGVADTLQEKSERGLSEWLSSRSPLWRNRPQMRGEIFLALYRLRNSVFGIKPTSKRRMIPGRYKENLEALKAILATARQDGIRVLVYVVPLRNDVEPPYVLSDYATFKKEIELTALAGKARYADLENVVPAEYWGRKASTSAAGDAEIDFMHFQASGHALLSRELEHLVPSLLTTGMSQQ